MKWSNIKTTIKKELRGIFRDKNSFKTLIFLPFIIPFYILLMGFMFDYSSILIRANSLIRKRIKNCFYNIFSDVIKSFSLTYS